MSAKPEAMGVDRMKRALLVGAANYATWADTAEKDALKSAAQSSWHMGRAGVFRQVAVEFQMLADLCDEVGR